MCPPPPCPPAPRSLTYMYSMPGIPILQPVSKSQSIYKQLHDCILSVSLFVTAKQNYWLKQIWYTCTCNFPKWKVQN